MYKVVVVEDEEIARKGIIFTINWDALNCMIAGEAANGEEGAEVIRRLRAEEAARRRRQWVRMGAAAAACAWTAAKRSPCPGCWPCPGPAAAAPAAHGAAGL